MRPLVLKPLLMAMISFHTSDTGEDNGVYEREGGPIGYHYGIRDDRVDRFRDDYDRYIRGRDIDDYTWIAKGEWTYSPHSKIRLNLSLELCIHCRNINLKTPLSSLLVPKDNSCVLCQFLSKHLKEARNDELEVPLREARQYIRICAIPEPQDNSTLSEPIQHRLPGLLQSGRQLHFELIKEWIRLCDEGKCSRAGGCCPDRNKVRMPTRVIDVGDGCTARLILTGKMGQVHYVALSHCWGEVWKDKTEGEKDQWSTTTRTKERRMQGFQVDELPQTFQDAITVTQELGQRYLWIDSLCIIQDDRGDWDTESKKMEAVFQNAYCTIAATSAEDSTKGFLNRPKEKYPQYVMVPESSNGKVYICTSIDDDFDGDVIKGVLNTRAWVLQERALSRRTIHFTKRQTYWECGGGVRCETLTHMKNAKLSFQSDPDFPSSIGDRSRSAQVELFQSLFADYSKFGITNEDDRPVAIASLATALAKALNTKVSYGIFESFLHRSLLWQPAQSVLTRIPYNDKAPPSWSWMAYHGQIKYLQMGFGDVEWDISVRFAKALRFVISSNYILKARVRRLRDCKIKPGGVIFDKGDNEVGQLYFDTQSGNVLPEVQCAVIGREIGAKDGDRKYLVLFVTQCATSWGRKKFRRVGMGWIQKRFILFDNQDKEAQIL